MFLNLLIILVFKTIFRRKFTNKIEVLLQSFSTQYILKPFYPLLNPTLPMYSSDSISLHQFCLFSIISSLLYSKSSAEENIKISNSISISSLSLLYVFFVRKFKIISSLYLLLKKNNQDIQFNSTSVYSLSSLHVFF